MIRESVFQEASRLVSLLDSRRESLAYDDGDPQDKNPAKGQVDIEVTNRNRDPESVTQGSMHLTYRDGEPHFDASWKSDYTHFDDGIVKRSWWTDADFHEHYGEIRNGLLNSSFRATEVVIDRNSGVVTVMEKRWDESPLQAPTPAH